MVAQRTSQIWSVVRVSSGNFLEMYDFMVFGYYAEAIGRTFFPTKNHFISLMSALMTFGAGFLMRPLGAIVLGAYADRHGRRAGLLLTLTLMSVGILSIACVPGYATIGALAPLLVLSGRLLQGFSAGMELGGVSVYLAEIATPGHKGFYVSWQSGSQQIAVMVAALVGVILSGALSPEQMSTWGWRVPLLLGCAIVPLLFVLRRSLPETAAFSARTKRPSGAEIRDSLLRHSRIVLLGTLLVAMTTVSFYTITAYTPTFGALLHLSAHDSLLVTLCVGASNLFWLPVMGALSDRIGRRPPLLVCTVLMLLSGLSGDALAGRRAIVHASSRHAAVAVVPLWQLQRRHGRHPHRNHAGRCAHFRLRPCLQPRHGRVRRFYPCHLPRAHAADGQCSDSRRVAGARGRLRPHWESDRHRSRVRRAAAGIPDVKA